MTPEPVDTGAMDSVMFDLADLTHTVGRLSETVLTALDADDSAVAVVRLLNDLREQRKRLAEVEAYVEAAAVRRLPYGKTRVGDLIAEVKGGKDRKEWRHDDLAWEACKSLCVDPDTGEIIPEARQIVDQVRSRLINCIGISYWRVGMLRQLDVNPDDFCKSEPGRRTVQLTPVSDEPGTRPAVTPAPTGKPVDDDVEDTAAGEAA